MAHEYTCEWLYHFTCSTCKNWWSWALSEPGLPNHVQENWHCPHCGKKDTAVRNHKIMPSREKARRWKF